tara:strand:- start:16256 stop:17098 length:843 start_codon:yes stop_codon:yes gene_type:complete
MFGLLLMISLSFVSAQTIEGCSLGATLVNQDPYPAVPGEFVKVVFQISGVEDASCGTITGTVVEKFPFSVDPESESSININSGTFVKDFGTHLLFPVKLRVDSDSLEGDNLLDLHVTSAKGSLTETFNINVEDLRVDFEVSIKDYNPTEKVITFEILNTGEHDVEALTVEISSQDALKIKGSSRNIIGSLDSNDDTTFTFEGVPEDGDITLVVIYTDEINERRTLAKTVSFNSDNFKGRGENKGTSFWFYVTLILVAWLVYSWWKKRRDKKKHHQRHGHH